MRDSRTAQDPTSDPSEASDAAKAILEPIRGMRPYAPTPSGRRRPASGRSPPGVGEGRGQSNSQRIGGPTPPIPQPRPGAPPLRPAIHGGPTPENARACAKYRSESGALPRGHKRAGALPPQRNCGEVSPPDLGTGGPTPSGQKIEGALPLSDPPPPSDPQPNSPHRGALAKPPAMPGSPPRVGTAPGHRRSLRPSELGKSGCGLASRPGACGADAPASLSRLRPDQRRSLPGIAFPPCGFSHSSLCGLRPCPYGVAPFRVRNGS